MLYRITKKSGSRRELKNTKNTRAKSSKKRYNSRSDSFSNKYYDDSSLSRDSDWDEEIQPAGIKETNILDHILTDNINKNKYQRNYAIENEPKFDSIFNLCCGTK